MMIEDTTINTSNIPDTSFTYTPQISRFMQALEYNMKARAGIDPAVSSEDIAAQRNLEMEEDATTATEKTLTSIDLSNPETMKSVLDSYRAYGRLLRSNSATAVIESFTDANFADKLKYDGVFRVNATNTDQDYPVYMTRGAIFESELIDNLENDNPSLYSYVRRFGAPVGLSIAGNLIKGTAGMFVTHGATAAYDVARLGTSIMNVQKKYHEWRNRLLNDETLTYDMFLEESKKLFADLKKEVSEEYRYEVYRALQEAPDPFGDLGNSFTGLAADVGIMKPVGGIGKTGFTAAKRSMKGVISASSKSKNVQKLQYNEELAERIKNFATNKVDEEVVEDVVNTKAAVNIPQEASPELQDTVKGIVREQESDNSLLQNVNNDSVMSAVEEPVKKSRRDRMLQAEIKSQKGEIKLERPQQVTVTRVGKGVNNDPMTWEEVQKWKKAEQGRANPITPWRGNTINHKLFFKYNPDIEPDLIGLQSASRTRWTNDINKPGKWMYSKTENPGAGDEWFLGGGYGSSIDSPWIAAPEYYYKDFSPDKFDFRDYVLRVSMDDRNLLKKAVKKFDPKGKTYKRTLSIYEDNRQEAIKSYKIDLAQAYALDSWFKRHNINPKDYEIIDKIERNMFDRYHSRMNMTSKYGTIDTNDISFKLVKNFFSKNKRDISSAINEAKDLLKKRDNEIKENVIKFIDDYKVYNDNMLLKYPYLSEDDIFEFGKSRVYDQNIRRWEKPDTIDYPMNNEEVMFNKLIGEFKDIISSSMDAEGLYRLIDMAENYKKYSPPTAYLQTVGIRNPMKNPKGIFYYDSNRGIVPFASLFNRANTPENMDKIREIAIADYKILNDIDEDVEKGFVKTIKELPDGEKEILWTYGDDPEPWGTLDNTMSEKEIINKFREYRRVSIKHIRGMMDFRGDLKMYVAPKELSSRKEYNSWEKSYLESKGFKNLWHNGGDSQSLNVSIQDLETVTPVTLEESSIGTPWWTQIGYHNAHMIESAGDGVGYYGLIVHAPEGAKPVIIKGGKIVDKGDWK